MEKKDTSLIGYMQDVPDVYVRRIFAESQPPPVRFQQIILAFHPP